MSKHRNRAKHAGTNPESLEELAKSLKPLAREDPEGAAAWLSLAASSDSFTPPPTGTAWRAMVNGYPGGESALIAALEKSGILPPVLPEEPAEGAIYVGVTLRFCPTCDGLISESNQCCCCGRESSQK